MDGALQGRGLEIPTGPATDPARHSYQRECLWYGAARGDGAAAEAEAGQIRVETESPSTRSHGSRD